MSKYNENTIYYVWLQQALGYGSPKFRTVLKFYNDAKEFYNIDFNSKKMLGCFTNSELANIEDTSLEKAEEILKDCEKLGYDVIIFGDDNYPKTLSEIYDPPIVLYSKGTLPNVDEILSIAIVGTRSASRQGVRTAFTFGFELAKAGAIVVSGGALGVDCAAHRGVLQAQGVTVCVLGCGIDYNYLSSNAQMRNLITENGAVISEYPPKTPPIGRNFPMRNRIISGLSRGLIVIEAGEKSGSLITAKLALEHNRDVFSVPGEITNTYKSGTNALIKQGAKITTNISDVLDEYEGIYSAYSADTTINEDYEKEIEQVPVTVKNSASTRKKSVNKSSKNTIKKEQTPNNLEQVKSSNKTVQLPVDISDDARKIYDVLSEMPVHTDEITIKSDLTTREVLTALTELELFGLIKSYSGRRFSK